MSAAQVTTQTCLWHPGGASLEGLPPAVNRNPVPPQTVPGGGKAACRPRQSRVQRVRRGRGAREAGARSLGAAELQRPDRRVLPRASPAGSAERRRSSAANCHQSPGAWASFKAVALTPRAFRPPQARRVPHSAVTHPARHLLALLSYRLPEPSTPRFCPVSPAASPQLPKLPARGEPCLPAASQPRTSAAIIPEPRGVATRPRAMRPLERR